MISKKGRKLLYTLIAALAIGWPLMELFQTSSAKQDPSEAVRLLHQVSMFQMDWLYSQLQHAGRAESLEELDLLLHSAYAAQYTHERLMLAVGKDGKPLSSVEALIQYIMRLQMGIGPRLSPQDTDVFKEAADSFQELHHPYRRLIGVDGKLSSTNETEVYRADEGLQRIFRQKLLE